MASSEAEHEQRIVRSCDTQHQPREPKVSIRCARSNPDRMKEQPWNKAHNLSTNEPMSRGIFGRQNSQESHRRFFCKVPYRCIVLFEADRRSGDLALSMVEIIQACIRQLSGAESAVGHFTQSSWNLMTGLPPSEPAWGTPYQENIDDESDSSPT